VLAPACRARYQSRPQIKTFLERAMNPSVRTQNDVVIVELEGEADLVMVPAFQSLMREQMTAKVPRLVVDFSKVTFVNTPIWAVVVEYYQHVTSTNTGFALSGMKARVEASFNIVRLGDFIAHYATVDEALVALKA
jgi:anti-anti-sigma factor